MHIFTILCIHILFQETVNGGNLAELLLQTRAKIAKKGTGTMDSVDKDSTAPAALDIGSLVKNLISSSLSKEDLEKLINKGPPVSQSSVSPTKTATASSPIQSSSTTSGGPPPPPAPSFDKTKMTPRIPTSGGPPPPPPPMPQKTKPKEELAQQPLTSQKGMASGGPPPPPPQMSQQTKPNEELPQQPLASQKGGGPPPPPPPPPAPSLPQKKDGSPPPPPLPNKGGKAKIPTTSAHADPKNAIIPAPPNPENIDTTKVPTELPINPAIAEWINDQLGTTHVPFAVVSKFLEFSTKNFNFPSYSCNFDYYEMEEDGIDAVKFFSVLCSIFIAKELKYCQQDMIERIIASNGCNKRWAEFNNKKWLPNVLVTAEHFDQCNAIKQCILKAYHQRVKVLEEKKIKSSSPQPTKEDRPKRNFCLKPKMTWKKVIVALTSTFQGTSIFASKFDLILDALKLTMDREKQKGTLDISILERGKNFCSMQLDMLCQRIVDAKVREDWSEFYKALRDADTSKQKYPGSDLSDPANFCSLSDRSESEYMTECTPQVFMKLFADAVIENAETNLVQECIKGTKVTWDNVDCIMLNFFDRPLGIKRKIEADRKAKLEKIMYKGVPGCLNFTQVYSLILRYRETKEMKSLVSDVWPEEKDQDDNEDPKTKTWSKLVKEIREREFKSNLQVKIENCKLSMNNAEQTELLCKMFGMKSLEECETTKLFEHLQVFVKNEYMSKNSTSTCGQYVSKFKKDALDKMSATLNDLFSEDGANVLPIDPCEMIDKCVEGIISDTIKKVLEAMASPDGLKKIGEFLKAEDMIAAKEVTNDQKDSTSAAKLSLGKPSAGQAGSTESLTEKAGIPKPPPPPIAKDSGSSDKKPVVPIPPPPPSGFKTAQKETQKTSSASQEAQTSTAAPPPLQPPGRTGRILQSPGVTLDKEMPAVDISIVDDSHVSSNMPAFNIDEKTPQPSKESVGENVSWKVSQKIASPSTRKQRIQMKVSRHSKADGKGSKRSPGFQISEKTPRPSAKINVGQQDPTWKISEDTVVGDGEDQGNDDKQPVFKLSEKPQASTKVSRDRAPKIEINTTPNTADDKKVSRKAAASKKTLFKISDKTPFTTDKPGDEQQATAWKIDGTPVEDESQTLVDVAEAQSVIELSVRELTK